jgi:membrane-associated phospholipid phosphatase
MVIQKNSYADHDSKREIVSDFAKFVSIFVAPPTMAIVATVCFSLWSPIGLGLLSAPFSILLCFFCFAFFPFFAVLYFYKKNFSDLDVSKRETRTPLLLIAITSYSVATIIFSITNTKILFLLALGCTFVSLIITVVNLFWKVSIHCAGVTGPIFSLIFVFGLTALPLSLIIGLVGWSRIKLKNHTFSQTLVGTLISLTVGIILYPILYV